MAKGKEITWFISGAALSLDALLMAFNLWDQAAFLPILEGWDLAKGLLATGALAALAVRFRSWLFGVSAAVLGLVVIVEEVTGYALTIDVMQFFGYEASSRVGTVPLFVYGELVVLGTLALLALGAVWVASDRRRAFATERNRILLLLGAEFFFALVIGFLAEFWNSDLLELFEETGERLGMSLILGYTVTLLMRRKLRRP